MRRRPAAAGARRLFPALLGMAGLGCFSAPAQAQLEFKFYQYAASQITTVTGIRGDNMTGNYSIPGGSDTGGLLFGLTTGAIAPFPTATSNGSNFLGALSSTPYGPSVGSSSGILRVVGSYITAASQPYDLGYLFDAAAPSDRSSRR